MSPCSVLVHGHEVVSITEHFYSHEGTPHLLVGVAYRLACPSARRQSRLCAESRTPPKPCTIRKKTTSGRTSWRSRTVPLFDTLRAWRTARARADGVPPYIVLTNVQLAEIANKRPATRAALQAIPGVGDGRIDKFGEELLRVTTTGVIPVEMKPAGKPRDRNLESTGKAPAADEHGTPDLHAVVRDYREDPGPGGTVSEERPAHRGQSGSGSTDRLVLMELIRLPW